ncbi:putative glycolipid-binding domain-containing protein [Thioclava dalianensis]|nr:putative glycolipid-binding domain-containing protein [Thioclava dalianensis]
MEGKYFGWLCEDEASGNHMSWYDAKMESFVHTVLWRRLDQPGYDACRIAATSQGWTIEGAAVFAQNGTAAHLAYRLFCDATWRSRGASVSGWVGHMSLDLTLERAGTDDWRVNGEIDPNMTGLDDIDLGFTPASNTNAIRRLDLSEGTGADCVAVWLDTEDWSVKRLPQSYHRTGPRTYAYVSPQHDYRATLVTDAFGAITDYPDLWTMCRT